MLHKLGIVEEELDETAFWLELVLEATLATEIAVNGLYTEVHELLAMTVASRKTLRAAIKGADNRQSKIENRK